MRRRVALLLALVALALVPGDAQAKFGISKTKVILPRLRPPAQPLIAETVHVEVKAESPEVTGTHVSMVRGRVEDALRSAGLVEVVDRPRDADAILRVSLSGLTAEVRDEIKMESKYVKIGERQEWNEKKKKMETKDVYGNRDTPVSVRVADGSLSASVEIEGRGGTRSADAGASYHDSFKVESGVPPEAATEESLRRFLVAQTADHVIGTVSFSPDPVEALLAVNDELKNGNRLAQSGLFQEAVDEWSRRTYKGGTEAARLHNLGVGYEALAYKLPPYTPEHRDYLEKAKQNYLLAMKLDAGEKYFRDPPARVDMSLSYAGTALMIAEEMQLYREERMAGGRDAKPAKQPGATLTKATPVAAAAPAAQPLKNGSFETSLPPWRLAGSGAVVSESGRGKVLDLPASASGATVEQALDVAVPAGREAILAFEYKVTSGEARLRVAVVYADANGKERTSNLEVTGGEGPGGWTAWSEEVSSLRPRPTRVKAVRIVAEGGGVRLDNVALNLP
ncbi:MAG TPA: hypothetical protein VFM88_15345 [Vicinamibacteria bacterium]|nr:hypothetical protein [Vicinamibacteria bacterium]